MLDYELLGKRIYKLRKEKGWRLQDLSNESGVPCFFQLLINSRCLPWSSSLPYILISFVTLSLIILAQKKL